MQNLQDNLVELLQNEENLVVDGELNKNKIIEAGLKVEPYLMKLLLSDKTFKKYFFTDVDGVMVFDKIKFQRFVGNKAFLPDSYTAFKNKIGLVLNDDYQDNFISTSKDVVLAFPYKDCVLEGGQTKEDQKRNEVFWSRTLAPDAVDRLLDPKVFTNFKKYDVKGESTPKEITTDDNLILKGNNLLVLSSLLKTHRGKIQLIYIDPPYNTDNDSFNYNDKFNHSTWLTFMKNRLEIAKELISENGSIYVQLDYNEVHYFKVLMDEIFGIENFQREIIWDINVLSGYKTMVKNWIRGHDSILFYTKNSKNFKFHKLKQPHTKEYEAMFNKVDEDGRKYMVAHKKKRYWDETKDKGKPFGDVWNDVMSFQQQPTSKERLSFDGQKPEKLLERIILSATDEKDIVLDFFGGTGTTASVAMKLNRKFVTIEQMDYVETTLKNRLVETLKGDDSVLSKEVNWKGGGSFVYAELMEYNQYFVDKIDKAKTKEELVGIWKEMQDKAFISYTFDKDIFDERLEAFKTASIENMKHYLLEVLDMNQLYVNYSEINDTSYNISDEDKALNKSFYNPR